MAEEAKPIKKQFAHPVVEDRHGVITPWYRGQNGQCELRVRIAEETLKRYPWSEPGQSVMPGHGIIAIRFWNRFSGEVMVPGIEIGPGWSEPGAQPVSFHASSQR
jgi:hypothetical protein